MINLEKLLNHPEYKELTGFGKPRDGHAEGSVENHIKQLMDNLEALESYGVAINETTRNKLVFLIHIHDLLKQKGLEGTEYDHPACHANLAAEFAKEFTDEDDLIQMIIYHDVNYLIWRQYKKIPPYQDCSVEPYEEVHIRKVVDNIKDLHTYAIFTLLDGYSPSKELKKLGWFVNELAKYRPDFNLDVTPFLDAMASAKFLNLHITMNINPGFTGFDVGKTCDKKYADCQENGKLLEGLWIFIDGYTGIVLPNGKHVTYCFGRKEFPAGAGFGTPAIVKTTGSASSEAGEAYRAEILLPDGRWIKKQIAE